MIVPADSDFHPSDPSITNWTETIGFWFAIPEESIYGNVYVLARPNVGATISSINVVQGINRHPFTVDLTDPQMHAPCPDSMTKFTLTSGLTVDVEKPPTVYRFGYENIAGSCSFDMTLDGSMRAWDPNDPAENPLLAASEAHSDLGLGDAWAGGHLDFVGRVRGQLTLRGKSYRIDSMGGIDRSWGRRTELGQAAISYIHVPFDENYGVHLVTGIELVRGEVVYGPLRFGYVHENGEVFGIVDASLRGQQNALAPYTNEITVTDQRGKTHRFRGTAVASAPWYTFSPSYVTFQALMKYEHEGRFGYGLMADTYGIEFLADRTSRHGVETTSSFGPGI
ncbi:DUF7064 domain-containing protein [Rhodococcoides kyotonense]|uniref:DUF7064 domain-containing protein n=1 Tax=Rhodococcoides kyotonense TaxID=398843 RepID=A0A239K3U1_9NOCA|nr:hypothetical protein [Rhodococcus kyotonensis]SNT12293.1 hypothetical protein SAMN05421642_109214 [Rhodococcus kyotonensis]